MCRQEMSHTLHDIPCSGESSMVLLIPRTFLENSNYFSRRMVHERFWDELHMISIIWYRSYILLLGIVTRDPIIAFHGSFIVMLTMRYMRRFMVPVGLFPSPQARIHEAVIPRLWSTQPSNHALKSNIHATVYSTTHTESILWLGLTRCTSKLPNWKNELLKILVTTSRRNCRHAPQGLINSSWSLESIRTSITRKAHITWKWQWP